MRPCSNIEIGGRGVGGLGGRIFMFRLPLLRWRISPYKVQQAKLLSQQRTLTVSIKTMLACSAFQALGIRVERSFFQALGFPVGGSASLGTWVPCPGSTWVPPVSHLCSPCVLLWLNGSSCTPTHRNGKVQREFQFWDP